MAWLLSDAGAGYAMRSVPDLVSACAAVVATLTPLARRPATLRALLRHPSCKLGLQWGREPRVSREVALAGDRETLQVLLDEREDAPFESAGASHDNEGLAYWAVHSDNADALLALLEDGRVALQYTFSIREDVGATTPLVVMGMDECAAILATQPTANPWAAGASGYTLLTNQPTRRLLRLLLSLPGVHTMLDVPDASGYSLVHHLSRSVRRRQQQRVFARHGGCHMRSPARSRPRSRSAGAACKTFPCYDTYCCSGGAAVMAACSVCGLTS